MKRKNSIILAAMIAALILSVIFSVSLICDRRSDERAARMLSHARASEAAERLAASLDAAHASFLPSDISSVRGAVDALSRELAELSLDVQRCAPLYRYLSLTGEIADNSLQLVDNGEMSNYFGNLFGKFSQYAHRLDDDFLPDAAEEPDYDLLDEIFSDLGAIYYDGAYSDEAREGQFSILKEASPLELSELDEIARTVFGDGAKLKRTKIHAVPEIYTYFCENASVDISVFGGQVLRILYDRRPKGKDVSAEEAEAAMLDFLLERRMDGLVPVELYQRGDYFGTFAPIYKREAGDVLCLCAAVKICVDADSGGVVSYDAEDYYRYYKAERDVPDVKIPEDSRLVYIVASNGRETLCYERDGEYFNAENGRRETKIY